MSRKFLLIDDDADDREFFCEAVGSIDEKIVCLAEANGRTAFEKLESKKIEKPDVIFLDVNMPLLNGWECLRILKSNPVLKDIPVAMFSTSSHPEEQQKAKQLGAVSFFKKPTDFKDLKKSLEEVIDYVKKDPLQALQ